MIAAALDVGTNTIRVLIRDLASNKNIFKKNYYLFLGKDIVNGILSYNGVKKLENTLAEIKQIFYEHNVAKTAGVATAFARKLGNPDAVRDVFLKYLNVNLQIIDAVTEGRLVFSAIIQNFGVEDFLVIDAGGGSTEFVFKEIGERELKIISADFGSLFLTQMFFLNYPPGFAEKESLCDFVVSKISFLKSCSLPKKVFGVGGTITTIAFLLSGMKQYKPEVINGFEITKSEMESFYRSIEYLNCEKLASIYPIEKGRETVLLAGSLMLLVIMNELEINTITASDVSLLEGVILSSKKSVFSI